MYQTGDKVVYGMHGVCVVADVENRVVDRKQVVYLALEPVGQTGSRFLVPTHNAVAMGKLRPMLDRDALESLLDSDAVHVDVWMKDENHRKQCYRELLVAGDRQKLVQMVYSLYRYRSAQNMSGRKFHLCDENFLRDAEKLLNTEFSLVLGIPQNQVAEYVINMLKD